MMVDNIIDPTTLARLQARAQQTGISTDAMLNQLLDEGARLLVSDVYDLVTIHTIEGAYKYVTPIMQSVLGYTQADSIGKRAADFVHPDDMDAFREAYNHLLSTGYSQLEYRARHKDGHYVWFDTIAHLVKDPATAEAAEIIAVSHDMTERKNYESSRLENERLVAQFRREREYTRLIQQSISALAHDLRTPLALIGTSKDLLLHYFDKLSDEKRQEKLESIGRQLEFALELIDDTVLSVRGALSDRRFNPAWVNLRKLCAVIVAEIASTTHTEQQLQFINTCTNAEMAWVDDVLVSRILLNLIGNAIKYSPADAPIQLELLDNELYTTLRVADNGLGIAPDHLPHLFEPFYRASETSNIEGTGLGLSIVKDCVDRHGGMITIESTLGHGTIVTVNLPKGKP